MSTTSRASTGVSKGSPYGMQYDVYAIYSLHDVKDVQLISTFLETAFKLKLYDPHRDSRPNETVIKGWVERGIYNSKTTLIFLSKHCIMENHCRYQADQSIVRYTMTKGKHRILLIMLKSCKIPRHLKQFHCVFAWKIAEQPEKRCIRILKALIAPQTKFCKGNLRVLNNWQIIPIANKTCKEMLNICCTPQNIESSPKPYLLQIFMNARKLKNVLENCELKCTSQDCLFHCSGKNYIYFFQHIKDCKYVTIPCRQCKQPIKRGHLQSHEGKTCRLRRVACAIKGCDKRVSCKDIKKHMRNCSFREEVCPYSKFGCLCKDKLKHLEEYKYLEATSKLCNTHRKDLQGHKYSNIPLGPSKEICKLPKKISEMHIITCTQDVFKCENNGCDYENVHREVLRHQHVCQYRLKPCPNCGKKVTIIDAKWHNSQCDQILQCGACHMYVPSSSKQLHDKWGCSRSSLQSICCRCLKSLSSSDVEQHMMQCSSLSERPLSEDSSEHDDENASFSYSKSNSMGSERIIAELPSCSFPVNMDKTLGPLPLYNLKLISYLCKWSPDKRAMWRALVN